MELMDSWAAGDFQDFSKVQPLNPMESAFETH